MTKRYELSAERFRLIEDLLPANGRRGEQWKDHRTILNGIFWVLNSGAQWREMPERYGKGLQLPSGPSRPETAWHPCRHPAPQRPGRARLDRELYRGRNVIERCVGWLKENRRLATRYEKLAVNFEAMVKLAMIRLCARRLDSSNRA